jgi:DHA2 family methylenomycin A resistance protein-like MFS transporter
MQRGVTESCRTIALVSPAYLRSVYGAQEWQAAWDADPQGFARKLVPIRIADCDRPGLLGGIVSIDLFGLEDEAASRRLLEQIDSVITGRFKPAHRPELLASPQRGGSQQSDRPGDAGHRGGMGARGRWLTLAVVGAGLFLAVLPTTAVSVALPTIGRDLHAGPAVLEWVVAAYLLVYSCLLVPGGVIGDRWGRRRTFVLGLALFGAGASLTGLAPSPPLALVGRVVQGVGPALLVPCSLAIVRATFHDARQRAAAIGLWSASAGAALAVGPVLGGVVVGGLSWRYVFFLNVPLSAALIVLAVLVPRDRAQAHGRFDWPGLALATAGVAALAFAVIEGHDLGWASPAILAGFAAGAAALAAFAILETRRPDPLVDVSLFAQSAFTAASVAAFVVFFSFVGALVYLSAYFQQVQGRSPLEAGLDVSSMGVAVAIAAVASGRLVGRFGERWPLVVGLTVAGAATLGLLRLGPNTGIGEIWWDLALAGAGIGLCGTATTAIATSTVGVDRAGMAEAMINVLRPAGQVFGVAVLGALVYASPQFVPGLHDALLLSSVALLGAAALAYRLVP